VNNTNSVITNNSYVESVVSIEPYLRAWILNVDVAGGVIGYEYEWVDGLVWEDTGIWKD
jgi:hypothetical protein